MSRTTCCAPGCREPRAEGGRGCEEHQAIYRKVRAEIEAKRNRQYVVRRDRAHPKPEK